MKSLLVLLVAVAAYSQVLFPLVEYLDGRPFVERLGYVPQEKVLRFSTADQKEFTAAALIFKTMMYYGGLIGESTVTQTYIPPDYEGMIQNIKTANKLDPYNMDAYYFAQAILSWDVGRAEEANRVLEFGMQYRDWDFYLPYFAGFNYAYFLKDYENAARYYQRAADLTGSDLLMRLTSRYLYESKQTDLAVAYLKNLLRTTHNKAIKNTLQMRLKALTEISRIEAAVRAFEEDRGTRPRSIRELVGYLQPPPLDPYGGEFYLDDEGRVKTTSNMATAGGENGGNKN